jgi:L-threonylcarbamoyladenylate synthase
VSPGVARWRAGDPLEPLARRLGRGGILAVPTESSYGLAVDPRSPVGVAAVYRVKGRDTGKPLPVVIADLSQLAPLGIDPGAPAVVRLARLWPAPLACVLPTVLPLPASAGTGGLAVRIPAHQGLCALLAGLAMPLTATSANASGEAPILDPDAAAALLAGEDAAVVVGPRLPGGLPSTLIAETAEGGFTVLRRGSFPVERLEAAWARGPEAEG